MLEVVLSFWIIRIVLNDLYLIRDARIVPPIQIYSLSVPANGDCNYFNQTNVYIAVPITYKLWVELRGICLVVLEDVADCLNNNLPLQYYARIYSRLVDEKPNLRVWILLPPQIFSFNNYIVYL